MAEAPVLLVIDSGTTSTRAILFGADGNRRGDSRREITQHYPRPGWVEHDAEEIWQAALGCAQAAVATAGGASRIAAIGITNQRETVIAWDRATGRALSRAIVWQDRRTADDCAALRARGQEPVVQARTGLLLDPYFSATKMAWLLREVPEVHAAARAGTLVFGTVESWLVFRLTGGLHITDASNASRTSLLALDGALWDDGLCHVFGIPRGVLPEVVDCAGHFGKSLPEHFGAAIPIAGMAGDQQAATIGQGCLLPGQTKATYGTGAFVLTNMGARLPRSGHRLLGTVLTQIDGVRTYALEGSVFVAGSLIKWLRDSMGVIETAGETAALAASVADSAGVVIVPALSGLGAPHWRPEARGAITGLSFSATRAHIARAALEAMSAQTHDLARAFAADGAEWRSLAIDGGMSANDWLAQDLADLLGLPVDRPAMVETTALGAAMLASVGCGLHSDLAAAASAMRGPTQRFKPQIEESVRAARLGAWAAALAAI